MNIRFKKIFEDAIVPTRATPMSVGYDLYSYQKSLLGPGEWYPVPTGIALELPPKCVGMICPRSGLAMRFGVTVLNAPGIIDPDYRGEVKVILTNLGDETFFFKKGDRIAQLVICQFETPEISVLNPDEEMNTTPRGSGGFGSTGR